MSRTRETMRCLSCNNSEKDAVSCRERYEDLNAKLDFLSFTPDNRLCFTDVVIVASNNSKESVPVPAHKFILAKRSPVFKVMLEKDQMAESLKISDAPSDAIRALVNFMYTAEVLQLDEQMACELLILAEKYQVEYLNSYCQKFLISILNCDNSVRIFVFSLQHNAKHLQDRSLDLITANMDKFHHGKEYPVLVKESPTVVAKIYESYLSRQLGQSKLGGQ